MLDGEKGSKLRCRSLVLLTNEQIASFFDSLVGELGEVGQEDTWQPSLSKPGETTLTDLSQFLSSKSNEGQALIPWWVRTGHNLPHWDFVCTFKQKNRQGLILVEAKAHANEFRTTGDRCQSSNDGNKEQISQAISEASDALNKLNLGFSLSAENHYQLSNRFAFAWKLASIGIPVILVYLGFLDAREMGNNCFEDHKAWKECVENGSNGIIPKDVWGKTFFVNGNKNTGMPLTFLIKSAKVDMKAEIGELYG